jgi:hypothetical protein
MLSLVANAVIVSWIGGRREGEGMLKGVYSKAAKELPVKQSATIISIVCHRRDFKQVDYTNRLYA